MNRLPKSMTSLCLLTVIGCGGGYDPPYPPELRAERLSSYQTPRDWPEAALVPVVGEVAGARLADDGIYVDLVVRATEQAHADPLTAYQIGWQLGLNASADEEPPLPVELRSARGDAVDLKPVRTPWSLFQSMHFAPPPSRWLDEDENVLVQTLMFRTSGQLRPGLYRFRANEWSPSWGPPWGEVMFKPLSDEWRLVKVDWPEAPSAAAVGGRLASPVEREDE